jgi:hypothetical protein
MQVPIDVVVAAAAARKVGDGDREKRAKKREGARKHVSSMSRSQCLDLD